MTMAAEGSPLLSPAHPTLRREADRASRRKAVAVAVAVGLHAAPGLLLLRPAAVIAPPVEPEAIVVELIRLEAAPPQPPSERAPGKEQVRSAQNRPAPREALRRPVIANAPDPLPVQDTPPRQAETATPQPPAPVTTAPPARPAPPAAQASSAPQEWRARLLAHLDRHKRYPAAAERQRQEGVAHIRFTMNRAGRVLSSSIVRGSGRPMLDREALAMLQRAQPLPTPPADEPGETIEIATHVDFFTRR